MTEPTLQQVLDAVNAVGTKLTLIEQQVVDLRGDRDDHESRIREVERRTDETKRIDLLEQRVNSHEIAFTKQGERVGALEARMASRINPIAVASVVAAFTSIVVAALLGIAAL